MENINICIMCCSPQKETLIDFERNLNIFTTICNHLNIESTFVTANFNFKEETLPFCEKCLQAAYELENLSNQKNDIEFKETVLVEGFKLDIKNSVDKIVERTKSLIPFTTSNARFDNFRGNVLQNNNRRMCKKRIASITGLPVVRNDDDSLSQSSVDSFDNLSVDWTFEQEIKEGEPNQTENLPNNQEYQDFSVQFTAQTEINILIPTTSTRKEKKKTPKLIKRGEDIYYENIKIKITSTDGVETGECSECGYVVPPDKKSPWRKSITNHIEQKHFSKCAAFGCNANFSTQEKLEKHIQENHNIPVETNVNNLKKCKKCKEAFQNLSLLRYHKSKCPQKNEGSKKSTNKIFTCNICDKTFGKESNLNRHVESHKPKNERKNSVCDKCGLRFILKQHLIVHLRDVHQIGTQPEEFKCPSCTKTFPTKQRLKSHVQSHEKNKNKSVKVSLSSQTIETLSKLRSGNIA